MQKYNENEDNAECKRKFSQETTIRKFHFKEEPYVMLSRHEVQKGIRDLTILGLYSYIMSLPDNWHLSTAHLAKHFGLNIQTAQKYIKKLISLGYAVRIQHKSNGRITKGEYLVFAEPITESQLEEIKKMFPETVFSFVEIPGLGKACTTKIIDTHKKETTTTQPPKSVLAKPIPIPNPEPPPTASSSSLLSKQENKILEKESLEAKQAYHEFCEANLKPTARNYAAERISCAQQGWWKNAPLSPSNLIEAHEKLARWIVRNAPNSDIVDGNTYIEFVNGMACTHLEYGTRGFEEICKFELKRKNISWTDLIKGFV